MAIAIITGAAGLIGSQAARFFHDKAFDIIGIDNDCRSYFFGPDASTVWNRQKMEQSMPNYQHWTTDIRDQEGVFRIFKRVQNDIAIVIHAAAQPSHDWAAREPFTDFNINANGTLVMLEACRKFCPEAVFIFTSTNKVYGDSPNSLPLVEMDTRWEIDGRHPYRERGIDENMTIDRSMHSLFGVGKTAADLMVQEYGRYFGLKTGVFRGGCLTGPAHSAAELHGFLAYLVKCAIFGTAYTIYGYGGKQVRDNIHSSDLVSAFWHYFQNPRRGEVYNIGGSRHSNCSMVEAIQMVAEITGKELRYSVSPEARPGDHIWWISDVSKFKSHYPEWGFEHDLRNILTELAEAITERSNPSAGTRLA